MEIERKQGDLEDGVWVELLDDCGAIVPVPAGATVDFRLTQQGRSVPLFVRPATVVDAAKGQVRYSFQAGDTDVVGLYRWEFIVNKLTRPQTFPSKTVAYLRVVKQA